MTRTPETGKPRLFGAAYSVYFRIARLALVEKGVDHDVIEVDIFADGGPPEGYRHLHPFGKIPVLDHGDFRVFETSAITRYVDEAFDGPALQPESTRRRARMNQIIGILDAYAYRTLVWDIYVERVGKPARGEEPDEARIAAALPVAETVLGTIADLKADHCWLSGDTISLADLHAAPMIDYFIKAPEGRAMLDRFDGLAGWWRALSARSSIAATDPADGDGGA